MGQLNSAIVCVMPANIRETIYGHFQLTATLDSWLLRLIAVDNNNLHVRPKPRMLVYFAMKSIHACARPVYDANAFERDKPIQTFMH